MEAIERDYDADHERFAQRLRAIHAQPEIQALGKALDALKEAYANAARQHWTELGAFGSTGWGQTPGQRFGRNRSVESCAQEVARELLLAFARHPADPPGSIEE